MVYVQRDGALVTGVFSNFNPGVTEETPLEDEHPDVLAYRARMTPRPVADVMPLIIGGLHSRISALEAKTDAEVLSILTTSGDPPADMVSAVEDEDPGEQDLGAEMLAAEEEAGENPGDGEVPVHHADDASAVAPDDGGAAISIDAMADASGVGGNDVPVYPGIAILPNVLADARDKAKVLISDAMVARLDVLNDPTLIQNAQAAFSAYNNYPAGSLIPDDIAQAYQRYVLDPATQQKNIFDHARMLLDAANRATEVDALQAIINDLDQRWP